MQYLPDINQKLEELQTQVHYLKVLTKPYQAYYVPSTQSDGNESSPENAERKQKIMDLKRMQSEKRQKILTMHASKKRSASPQPKSSSGKDNYLTELLPNRFSKMSKNNSNNYQTMRRVFGQDSTIRPSDLGPEPIRHVITEKGLDKQLSFLESSEYMQYIKDFSKVEEEHQKLRIQQINSQVQTQVHSNSPPKNTSSKPKYS